MAPPRTQPSGSRQGTSTGKGYGVAWLGAMAGAGIGLLPSLFIAGAELWDAVTLAYLSVVTFLAGLGVGSCAALRWRGYPLAVPTGITVPIMLIPAYMLALVLFSMFDVYGTSDRPVEGVVVVVVLVLVVASSPLISRWLVLRLGSNRSP